MRNSVYLFWQKKKQDLGIRHVASKISAGKKSAVNSLGLERKSATSICDPETPKTEQKAVPVVDSVGGWEPPTWWLTFIIILYPIYLTLTTLSIFTLPLPAT